MAETSESQSEPNPPNTESEPSRPAGFAAIKEKLLQDKIESAIWMSRIITVVCAFFTLIPLLGDQHSMYSKALISCAACSALRLRQRVPHFRFAREYVSQLMAEDSCHYLLYSLLFATSAAPFTMALVPITLFALLGSVKFTNAILDLLGEGSVKPLRWIIAKLTTNSITLYRFAAMNEIMLMPALIFMIFGGQTSILAPFLYYRILCLRYTSRRNQYCRTLFYELRLGTDALCAHPSCPQIVQNIVRRVQGFIIRIAPPMA